MFLFLSDIKRKTPPTQNSANLGFGWAALEGGGGGKPGQGHRDHLSSVPVGKQLGGPQQSPPQREEPKRLCKNLAWLSANFLKEDEKIIMQCIFFLIIIIRKCWKKKKMRFCLVIYVLLLCGLGVSINRKFMDGDLWQPRHALPVHLETQRTSFLFPPWALENDITPFSLCWAFQWHNNHHQLRFLRGYTPSPAFSISVII